MIVIDPPQRPPTGPMKFARDWPGVFIRGDEALALASNVEMAQRADFLPQKGPGAVLLEQVAQLLRSCDVGSAG
jgi:hypothetical protein